MAEDRHFLLMRMLGQARSFEYAADFLLAHLHAEVERPLAPSEMLFIPPVMVPFAVLSAFSVELYLKTLLVLEGADYGRHHRLLDHFLQVSEAHRRRIEHYHDEWRRAADATSGEGAGGPPLEESLRLSNRAFEEWRYIFEHRSGDYHAHGIICALKRTIQEIEPRLMDSIDRDAARYDRAGG